MIVHLIETHLIVHNYFSIPFFLYFIYVLYMEVNKGNVQEMLNKIHNTFKIKYGSFNEEYPEQEMACMFIKSNDYVLEIGGNIGRNSILTTLPSKEGRF